MSKIEGMGRRAPDKEKKAEIKEGIAENDSETIRIEKEKDMDLIHEKMEEILPTNEQIKSDVSEIVSDEFGAELSPRLIEVLTGFLAADVQENLEIQALAKICSDVDKDAFYEVSEDIYQAGSSNAHGVFDWLRASTMTFSPSDLAINPETGRVYVEERREMVKNRRNEIFKRAEQAVKDNKSLWEL